MKNQNNAIRGLFTIQDIKQQIEKGERIIKLEYDFIHYPDGFFNKQVGYTQQPVIKSEVEEIDECDLLDQLHDATEREIKQRLNIDIYFGSGGVVKIIDLEKNQIGFYLQRRFEQHTEDLQN